jgi:hypothetical protein
LKFQSIVTISISHFTFVSQRWALDSGSVVPPKCPAKTTTSTWLSVTDVQLPPDVDSLEFSQVNYSLSPEHLFFFFGFHNTVFLSVSFSSFSYTSVFNPCSLPKNSYSDFSCQMHADIFLYSYSPFKKIFDSGSFGILSKSMRLYNGGLKYFPLSYVQTPSNNPFFRA